MKYTYHLPNSHLFRYLQLRHAYNAQFGSAAITMRMGDLEAMICDDALDKALSNIYKQPCIDIGKVLTPCRNAWVAVFPQLDGYDWNDLWEVYFIRLLSARDHLIQYKFLHRIYPTPARLAGIFPTQSPSCWWCTSSKFWECTVIQQFWLEVTTIFVRPCIETCLLGLVDSLAPRKLIHSLLTLLVYCAGKLIILSWKKPTVPAVPGWKVLINKILPFYKAMYISRGGPNKFDKVWGAWVNNAITVSE